MACGHKLNLSPKAVNSKVVLSVRPTQKTIDDVPSIFVQPALIAISKTVISEANKEISAGGSEFQAAKQEVLSGDNEAFSKRWTRLSFKALETLKGAGQFQAWTIVTYRTKRELDSALGGDWKYLIPETAYMSAAEQSAPANETSAKKTAA